MRIAVDGRRDVCNVRKGQAGKRSVYFIMFGAELISRFHLDIWSKVARIGHHLLPETINYQSNSPDAIYHLSTILHSVRVIVTWEIPYLSRRLPLIIGYCLTTCLYLSERPSRAEQSPVDRNTLPNTCGQPGS